MSADVVAVESSLWERVRDYVAANPRASVDDVHRAVGGLHQSVQAYMNKLRRSVQPHEDQRKTTSREVVRAAALANPHAGYKELAKLTGLHWSRCKEYRLEMVGKGEIEPLAGGRAKEAPAAGERLRRQLRDIDSVAEMLHGLRHSLKCLDADCDQCLRTEEMLEESAFGEAGVVADALDDLVALRALVGDLLEAAASVRPRLPSGLPLAALRAAVGDGVDLADLPLPHRVRLAGKLSPVAVLPAPAPAPAAAPSVGGRGIEATNRELAAELARVTAQRDEAQAEALRSRDRARAMAIFADQTAEKLAALAQELRGAA